MEDKEFQVEPYEKGNSSVWKWIGIGVLSTILALVTMVVINL